MKFKFIKQSSNLILQRRFKIGKVYNFELCNDKWYRCKNCEYTNYEKYKSTSISQEILNSLFIEIKRKDKLQRILKNNQFE